ncbi:MAG: integrase arm-type DNA-binding domain-containing protein [Aestuariivita sp.]|nr:integrase arm-type DNA-binding domain-containing protein [Aestuariivita sp.]
MDPLLTDHEIAANLRPGLHRAGETKGLWINVTKSGTRSWVFRYTPPQAEVRMSGATAGRKKPRAMGLGGFPDVDLATASDRAIELRKLLAGGIDPLKIKHQAGTDGQGTNFAMVNSGSHCKPFGEIVEAYLSIMVEETGNYRSAVHRRDWRRSLEIYALPLLAHVSIESIDTDCILRVLQQPTSNRQGECGPLWSIKPVTANRLRGRLQSILSWAAFHGMRSSGDNPARWHGHLKLALVSPSRIRPVQHFDALPYKEVPYLMRRLKFVDGQPERSLEFAILSACRSSEVRNAKWQEIDFEARVWTIPAERMKTYRTHRIPLTDRMQKILLALPRMPNSPYIFIDESLGGRLPESAMRRALHRLKYQVTQHGFRSSFRDWAAETGVDWIAAEYALSHRVGTQTSRAYHRSDLLEERRKIMAQWELFCYSKSVRTET